MKKFIYRLLVLVIVSMPTVALAQFTGTKGLVAGASGVVNDLIKVVFALGLLVFFWGIVKYISAAGDVAKAKEGKSIMTWGVIAMFVMAAIWGILAFISKELQIDLKGYQNAPGTSSGGGSGCGITGSGLDEFGSPC